MHTQVGIIGAGPAGLFLAHLLYREGIDCVVLEARSRAYVEDRVRAGVLEQGTVDLMAELGLDQRLRRECMIDEAIDIRFGKDKLIHVHFPELVAGKVVTIYGQQEVVKDLIAARIADGAPIEFEAEVTALDGLDTGKPTIRYRQRDTEHTLTCDVIAGDAAHIVPPTGAKGLNLAATDVRVLARALTAFFRTGSVARLDRYSDRCLRRVWKVVRYSWFMTSLLHRFPHYSQFERNIQLGELDYLLSSRPGP